MGADPRRGDRWGDPQLSFEARYWAKVDRRGPDECWPWLGGKSGAGYGVLRDDTGKHVYAHREALRLAGADPGIETRHSCDTPGCVNPGHLLPGDHADNMADMGRRHRRAWKLTPAAVADIRASRGRELQRVIGERHGVSQSLVSQIQRQVSWRHLPHAGVSE